MRTETTFELGDGLVIGGEGRSAGASRKATAVEVGEPADVGVSWKPCTHTV